MLVEDCDLLPSMLTRASHVYIAVELLIALMAVAGNVLVCWAVSINSNLQNITNFFVVSLAVADIAVGLLAIPFAVTISTGFCSQFHGCLFIACFVLVLTQSSIFSLLAIAIDRYIAIKIPLRYNSLVTSARAKGIIALCWILSVVIGLTPMMGWNRRDTDYTNSSCPAAMTKCLFEEVVTMGYMVYFNFFGCVLTPLLAMLAIYARIFMAARRQLIQMELKLMHVHGEGSSSSRSTLQREVHAAKSLAIIVGLFAVCWLPVHIINCFTLFCPTCARAPGWVMYTAIVLSHANSVVNPFIYAYRIREFRHTFRRILRKQLLGRKQDLGVSSNSSASHPCNSTGISVVDTLHGTAVNGYMLDSSPNHSIISCEGNRSLQGSLCPWASTSDLCAIGYVTNGHHPADSAMSVQSKQQCPRSSPVQNRDELFSSKQAAEVMEMKHCSTVSTQSVRSLIHTRTNHPFELTDFS